MKMDPVALRALLHERTHHTIEVPLYPTLLKWQGKPIGGFGEQAQLVFDVWHERGLIEDATDIQWVKRYLTIAEKIRSGQKVTLDEPLPASFDEQEMAVVNKLIFARHSIRDWINRELPDEMIEKILEAGRAAPIGCNLGHIRFIVLKDPEEKQMIWSDVNTQNAAAIIVVCHDKKASQAVGQNVTVPQNAGFDAAAAADHMLLMAHALGLGAVWLSEIKGRRDTAKEFKEKYGLPNHIEVDLHIAIGWPAMGTIKSARVPLKEMVIQR